MTQSGEFSATSTPLPPELQRQLPSEIVGFERDFRHGFRSVREGYLAPRAALGACIEILTKEAKGFDWIAGVINCVPARDILRSHELLTDWSEARLLTFFGRLFRASWSIETCAAVHRGEWRSTKPDCGQSCVTSLIVQEIMGGKIRRGSVEGSNYGLYFLNELSGGRPLELTRSQFHPAAQILPGKEVETVFLLDPKPIGHDYARAANVPERYALLKRRFLMAVGGMALASVHAFRDPGLD